jgi:hypothetical protein
MVSAAPQYQELERGQVLQRGTASLPALPGATYRQELLGGFPSRCGHRPEPCAWLALPLLAQTHVGSS